MLLALPRALALGYGLDRPHSPERLFFSSGVVYSAPIPPSSDLRDRDGWVYGVVEGQVQFLHLGEETALREGYGGEVRDAVEGFVRLTSGEGESSIDARPPYYQIRAVVLSGDAFDWGDACDSRSASVGGWARLALRFASTDVCWGYRRCPHCGRAGERYRVEEGLRGCVKFLRNRSCLHILHILKFAKPFLGDLSVWHAEL